ncbi:IS3 family transposase [Elizabethkingia anophelis]|nr:IS3 family transposase [Elizabethkingia anophelis]
MSTAEKRGLICPSYRNMSVHQQCKVIELPHSSYYFKPKGESIFNQQLMKAIDRKFLDCPFYGVERMRVHLRKDLGHLVSSKRVRRLYKLMNLKTIYPKKNLSWANKADYKFPYLLRNLEIKRVNQVWQADITYIPMFRGFMYMFAIIDVYSRKIMGWGVSNTMNAEWCRDIMLDTIARHGTPEIFNTDQGSQFTSSIFVKALQDAEVQISMDGKGRALDNVYIERFWGSLKREKIYLNPPNGGLDLYQKVKDYVQFYNTVRRHDSLNDETPDSVYAAKKAS